MSPVPNTSNPTLENQLNEVIRQTDIDNPRSRAITIEAYQRYIEHLEELILTPVKFDTSVTIKIDGKTIRFPNEDAMTEFSMEME